MTSRPNVVTIRPMPRAYFRGPFFLCDRRKSCKGAMCTFPHSKEEQDAWNKKKFGSIRSALLPTPPPPGPPIPTLSSSLGSSPYTWADACAGRPPPRSRFLSEPTTSAPESIPTSLPIQRMQPHSVEESPWPDPVFELGHQPAVSPIVGPSISSPFSHVNPFAMPRSQGDSPQVLPEFPTARSYGGRAPLDHPTHDSQAMASQRVTAPAVPQKLTRQVSDDYAARMVKFHDRLKERLFVEDVQQELTRANYKEKFNKLLCWEEKAHIDILDKRCKGKYTLVLHQAGLKTPDWMKFDAKSYHKRFGYICGLSGDQIAYATQASEGAVIVCDTTEIRADILRENFSHTDDRLYLAFDERSVKKLSDQFSVQKRPFKKEAVCVEFELKHFYFNSLHESIESLPRSIVTRIMPKAADFPENRVNLRPLPKNQRDTLGLSSCSPDQQLALQTIVSCPSSGPPVLIAGPFGTGKTHILATAVHFFFQQSKEHARLPVRVLVCTQQQVSADTFLQCYFGILAPRDRNVIITRLTTKFRYRNPELKRWYKTVQEFERTFQRSSHSNESDFLVVTTCNTSLLLTNFLFPGFFTHILLDEGAQTREPEGITPLCMADHRTKIVIAGDHHQVGPAMLVLGEEAQENGLAVSLLERLQNHYQKLGEAAQQHCVTLVTNYRCHSGILKLAEELFYETPLHCWDQREADGSAHPKAPFPLQFVCSSINDTTQSVSEATNEGEARIVLQQAQKFAASWPIEGWGPKDLAQICFITPTRSQVTVAGRLMKRMPEKMNNIRRVPTYDIQGREYRAIFISTSEPTERNGKTCNPTKSISDRYVFNTAITRARSLVVAVGNPFLLLRVEDHMVKRYGRRGNCWSTYLHCCLENNSLSIDPSVRVSNSKKRECLDKLRELVQRRSVKSHYVAVEQVPAPVMQITPKPPPAFVSTQGSHTGVPTDEISSSAPSPPLESKVVNTLQEVETQEVVPLAQEAFFNSKFDLEFERLERLGKGGFGLVYHVRNRNDNEDYAIKIVKLPNSVQEQKKVKREVKAFVSFKGHPRVVRYYQSWTAKAPCDVAVLANLKSSDSLAYTSHSAHSVAVPDDPSLPTSPSSAATPSHSTETSVGEVPAESSNTDSVVEFRDSQTTSKQTAAVQEPSQARAAYSYSERPTCLFIQMELCERDTLKEWLRKNVLKRERKVVFDYFNQILEAVLYIHGKDLIHRDLKPSNIFFSREDRSVKVGDFGLVAGNFTTDLSGERQPKSRSSRAGTLLYMAPEQLERKEYDNKVDVFALGMIFFELNCPFGTEMERHKDLSEIRRKRFPSRFVDKLPHEAQMIEWLLASEPSERPSAKEIMASEHLRRLQKAVKKAKDGCVPKF